MKIALFGGAFNPPHLGHLQVADALVDNKIVDQVWFIPVFQHPWAERYGKVNLTDYEQRCKMLELMISGNNSHKIQHFKDVSFTYDTLVFFSKKFREHEFCWVMGSEYLSRFDDFLKGHPKLLDFPFYIYPRAGFPLDKNLQKNNMFFLENMKQVDTSSTEIKNLIAGGQDSSPYLHEKVFAYIKDNELYKKE